MKIDSDITFRKLEIFIAFMSRGNLARTAEALGISSVSVHRALHSLEESVRCPLFIHQGRNLVPLPAAQTLWEYSQETLDTLSRGVEETRKAAGIGQGHIRLGTLYSLTLETIPKLIMGMKLRRPDLEMQLTMGSNQLLTAKLEDGYLDAILIAVTPGEIDHSRFEMLPLFDDDIFLAARPLPDWTPASPPICAIFVSRNLSRWRKGLPPGRAFRRRLTLPDTSRILSPG